MPENLSELLYNLTEGDSNAVIFMRDIWYAAQVWDDTVDKEEKISTHDAFYVLSSKIPSNPFYQDNIHSLVPMINQVILDWKVANHFESEKIELDKAYMLRAGLYRLFHHCILLSKGFVLAEQAGIILWKFYGETLEDFKKEILNA